MPSFLGNPFSGFFNRILQVNQSSNTGVDTTVRKIQDGAGNDTAIAISDDEVFIKPENDNTQNTLTVYNKDTNVIFTVDTINSKLKGGASQTALNTQNAFFGTQSGDVATAAMAADTHYAIPFSSGKFNDTAANMAMGSSTSSSFNDTNPATSLTISNTAMSIITAYWYVMDDITIDAVKWFHAADAATGEATAAHLMSYSVDIGNSGTSGDLSSGTVVADGANITNAGYEQIYYQSMTIQSADVDAGKVIRFWKL